MNQFKLFFLGLFLMGFNLLNAQANLTIVNKSSRLMVVKVMKENGTKSNLYKKVTISANSLVKVYFSASGNYYTKSKAILKGKTPICKKGNPFNVVNDGSGYSELTLTYTIIESTTPNASGGATISESEFDKE